jgi:hypothetical protein
MMRRWLIPVLAAVMCLAFMQGAAADGITPVGSQDSGASGAVVDIVRITPAGENVLRRDILVDTTQVEDPEAAADQVAGVPESQAGPNCQSTPQQDEVVAEYCLNVWAWPSTAMPVRVKYNPDDPGGAAVPSAIEPIQNAIEQWSSVTQNFKYLFDGTTTARPTACDDQSNADGINTIAWVDGIGGVNGILAQTCTVRQPDGALVEFDMQLNANMAWSIDTPTPSQTYDLYSNILHEMGHGAGIAHSQYPSAVMFQSLNPATEKRTLTPDDEAALKAKYDAPAQSGVYHLVAGGLSRE